MSKLPIPSTWIHHTYRVHGKTEAFGDYILETSATAAFIEYLSADKDIYNNPQNSNFNKCIFISVLFFVIQQSHSLDLVYPH